MTSDSKMRVLDAGGPLFLHERPPYDAMPPCGRGVCVETPSELASLDEPFIVALRRMERHGGGPADVEIERFGATVSLATGQCAPQDVAADRLLAELSWIPAALASQLDPFRRRARRLVAQRDRNSYGPTLDRAAPGAMLPYDRLFPHDWDLIIGHDQHVVWACDQHCPNPSCSCREIAVALYDINTPKTRPLGQIRIDLQSGTPDSTMSSPSAARWFEPLWAAYGTELTRRYDEVRRAIVARSNSRPATALSTPPSRNAPCPCGSGKKFKRCCAIRSASAPPTRVAR